jgi:membrane associated rhomboid family serine protease
LFPLKDNIPTDRFPVVTVTLIALNVAMYLFFQDAIASPWFNTPDEQNVIDYGAIPYEFTHPGDYCELVQGGIACEGQPGVTGTADPQPATWLTALTSMFMHGSLIHLGGNMLFLWIFGNNVEDSMGPVKYVVFYLLAGFAATAAQIAIGPDAAVPGIGASGAVAGVLGGYILLFPRARVVTLIFIVFFFTIIELPALLILGFWFIQQVLFGYFDLDTGGNAGGVAYFAHIGGFVFGLIAIKLFADERKRRRQQDAAAWGR